ncbi:MAG: hypothetical protein AAF554_05010 [Bacteroidota bacterium]
MISTKHKYALLLLMAICFFSCKEKQLPKSVATTPLEATDSLVVEPAEVSYNTITQDTLSYRDQNWYPEKGRYYFSETYHFNYYNETIPSEEGSATGEFGFYVDSESGTLLVEKYISNYVDEMADYVIVHQDGHYIMGFTDEFGEKKILHEKISEVEGLSYRMDQNLEDFNAYFQKQNTTETFGANKYYPKTMEGQSYLRTFPKTQDTVELFLAKSKLPTKSFYLLQQVFPELGMPIRQDYGLVLPENTMVVKEHYETTKGQRVGFQLTSIMASEYHIQLPE